jgi:hypothetical protein
MKIEIFRFSVLVVSLVAFTTSFMFGSENAGRINIKIYDHDVPLRSGLPCIYN